MSDALERIEKVLRDVGIRFIDEQTELGLIVPNAQRFSDEMDDSPPAKPREKAEITKLKKRSQKSL